jgi:hypothetical protein
LPLNRSTTQIAGAKSVPKIKLNDVGLRALKPPQSGTVDYWDTKPPSFGYRVSQGGAKTSALNNALAIVPR